MRITITKDFGWVLAALFSTFITNFFLVIQVVSARKAFGVKYPALYAPPGHKHEEKFNCIQRAHQNYLENWSQVMIMTVVNGLFYPKYAAAFCAVFAFGRIVYGYGYKAFGPSGRQIGGMIAHLGDIPLMLMMPYIAYNLLSEEVFA
mmetsp:Transcript_11103/g.21264  ORF Transcript_11103/g.21264 Transcript_11103/m.21264 type:complete len:147 (-) Transcript_11103:216-656(-)|eukprot:CAMPEP_0170166566 /NCGR_PEP_ID=MMETSP0040_2-20121228/220_1 /TAXON_ID=641309 /ORGANISM="Lotharella oceanica, Strain CCMP622" /LENGTH=146 /DNA_ID=CAMNT_0010404321 /DNA_START=75 /DNA_END=515 /DNA_ORIENTATION=+